MSSPGEPAVTSSASDAAAPEPAAPDQWAFPSSTTRTPVWRQKPSRVAGIAFLIGLLVTGAFAFTSVRLYDHNESHLLGLRAREVGSVLTAVVPSIQTPLASAAELADATNGSAQKFREFMALYVGPGRQFGSASLWRLGSLTPVPKVVVGAAPILASMPAKARAMFAHAEQQPLLNITALLSASTSFRANSAPRAFSSRSRALGASGSRLEQWTARSSRPRLPGEGSAAFIPGASPPLVRTPITLGSA